MSLANEFATLLYSDVSTAAIDQLVTKTGLWVRNTLLHFLGPFALTQLWFHFWATRRVLRALLWFVVGLQVLQLWSPGALLWLAIDGAFDIAVIAGGITAAWWLAMREVRV